MRDGSAKYMRDHVISRDPRDHVPAAQYHRRHRDHRDTRLGERPYPTDDEHRSTCLTGLLGLFVSLSIALSAALYVGYYKIDRGAGGPLFVVARVRGATGGTEISGVVRFWQRPDGGVLFVIARPQGATGGPPLAVLRIPSPEFPLAFTIGPENVMIPSMQFAGAISISARLDADGNAMTRGSGDISSATVEGLSPGAEGVRLVLSERG